jgi:hypothetical protein
MEKGSVETIVRAFRDARVRYLIAGGLAVVAHGFVRFTADVDVILATDATNLERAIEALRELQYRPRAPVPIESFADARERARWASEKGMKVFSLSSPAHPDTEVDLFLEPPLDFERAHVDRVELELAPGLSGSFVGRRDLIELKRHAGRPQDLIDIAQLERRAEEDRST